MNKYQEIVKAAAKVFKAKGYHDLWVFIPRKFRIDLEGNLLVIVEYNHKIKCGKFKNICIL